MTSEGDRGQGDDDRDPVDPAAPGASPLRPDPDWGRPRPTPRGDRRFSWGGEDDARSSGTPGGAVAPDPAPPTDAPEGRRPVSTAPREPASGRPPGATARSVPPPPPAPTQAPPAGAPSRQGGERPARSWAAPRIAAPPASGGSPAAPSTAPDPDALRLPVDEPAVEGGPAPVSSGPRFDTPSDPPAPRGGGRAGATAAAPPVPPPPPGAAPAPRTERPAGEAAAAERRNDRTTVAVAELAQQLAATQAQVTSLSAQLTTLSHRITYDLERGAQATSERVLRDLDPLPEQVSFRVGAHLGPAIDDLTEQIEVDRDRLRQVIEGDFGARLRAIGETVDALPLANVEVLNGLQSIGADLEDRLTRFATRIADQVTALESATTSELAKLRDQLEELQAASERHLDQAALDRMAGQVERLAERPSVATEIIDAVELLVTEHLDALRDNVEARVGALAPVLHEELEAVRAEAQAGVSATEEVLTERIDALESGLTARMEEVLHDQIDAVDALIAQRHDQLLGAVAPGAGEHTDEVVAALTAATERLDEAVGALHDAAPAGAGTLELDDAALDGIREELQALRRRISLRFEAGDPGAGLTAEQLEALAAQIAAHLT